MPYIWANSLQTSIGYESEFGGRTQLNRVAAAGKTDFEEARFVASYPVAPDFQVLGEVNHQFTNVGGFRQDVGVTIRTLYTFQAPSPAPAPEQVPPPPALAAPAAVPAPEQQREFQVFFDFDQANITDAASRVIQAAADVVRSGGIAHITVTGHTDTVGTARYNQALSERRAGSVRTRLITDGVDGGEISTVGAGKTGLLVPTADGVREPQNRRAVIELR